MTEIITGKLDAFAETGTEGILWSLYDNTKEGYDGLFVLENGDNLEVFQKDGKTLLWSGIIKLEYKRNYRPYPMNPEYGQQEVLGYWVHGFQENLEPEVWGKMFFHELPARLTREKKQ